MWITCYTDLLVLVMKHWCDMFLDIIHCCLDIVKAWAPCFAISVIFIGAQIFDISQCVFQIGCSEQKKLARRKATEVLIQDIGTEEGSTVVCCQLSTGNATITFTFNCDLDTADEIVENLVSVALCRLQLGFIFFFFVFKSALLLYVYIWDNAL